MSVHPDLAGVPLLDRAQAAWRLMPTLDLDKRFDMLGAVLWPSGTTLVTDTAEHDLAARPVEDPTGQLLFDWEGLA